MMNHGEEKYVDVDRAVSAEAEQPEAEVKPTFHRGRGGGLSLN